MTKFAPKPGEWLMHPELNVELTVVPSDTAMDCHAGGIPCFMRPGKFVGLIAEPVTYCHGCICADDDKGVAGKRIYVTREQFPLARLLRK